MDFPVPSYLYGLPSLSMVMNITYYGRKYLLVGLMDEFESCARLWLIIGVAKFLNWKAKICEGLKLGHQKKHEVFQIYVHYNPYLWWKYPLISFVLVNETPG